MSRDGSVRLKVQGAENEIGDDEDDGCGDDLVEGILDEGLQPTPEEPFELWHDEKRNEDWPHQDTDGGSDKAEGDDNDGDGLGGGEQDDDDGIDDAYQENRQSPASRCGIQNR